MTCRGSKISLFLFSVMVLFALLCGEDDHKAAQNNVIKKSQIYDQNKSKIKGKKKKRKASLGPQAARFFGEAVHDAFSLHKNLLHWDSFKVITATFPFFVGARIIDEKLQRCFYDSCDHKNRNEPPKWCHDLAEWSIAIPIVFLGSQAFFAKDVDLQTTSRIFLVGMPFVIWTKDLIKRLNFKACLRPWNEHFSCDKRALGGFPSGHVAQATFAAVLYGSRFGYKYAVPLSALAVFVSATFLACNRHYVSQLVAGAGFGAMYALAANKLVQSRLIERLQLGFSINKQGVAMKVAFQF